MIKTCLARIVGVGKDVQRFQASVILRAFFTAFPCFHLTTMSMKGFIPWRYFKKEQRHIKGKQNKTLKSDVFAEFTKHVQQSTGLSCSKCWKRFSLPLLQCPATFSQGFSRTQHVESPRTALEVVESKLWPCFNERY